jgi:hypothetical protein
MKKKSILEKRTHEKIQLNIPEDGLNKSAELMNIWKKKQTKSFITDQSPHSQINNSQKN